MARHSRVRLADVAQLVGVSTTTASRALNGRGEISDVTRAAVLEAADRLGFRPSPFAQSLQSRRSNTVGLIVPNVAHHFYATIVQGAQAYLKEAGYQLVLIDSGEDAEGVADAIDTLIGHWVDGIMITTTPFTAVGFSDLLHGTPCVFIDETVEGVGAGSITLENRDGIALLVDHLAETHGHERIAFLGGRPDRTDGRERREGFLTAMARRGLLVAPEHVSEGEWSVRSGVEQTLHQIDLEGPPTALIAASAELALGALAAARSRGLNLPEDMAIVSFDDPEVGALLEPALTAITYDTLALGERSARLLVAAFENDNATFSDVRLPVALVTRRSCGCAFDTLHALKHAGFDDPRGRITYPSPS
ncbi:MAG: LacI family DNA-binding transcriptional regulator [Acidimicrobiales bacterium]|jgi:DNA-binding LacI/PurR family transcriptional regulator